jgi:uncharacterized protein
MRLPWDTTVDRQLIPVTRATEGIGPGAARELARVGATALLHRCGPACRPGESLSVSGVIRISLARGHLDKPILFQTVWVAGLQAIVRPKPETETKDVPRLSIWPTVILAALAISIGLFKLVDWAAEYLWFEAQGYEAVFWTIRELKIGFFLSAFFLTLLYFWINFQVFSSLLDPKAVSSAWAPQPSDRSVAAVLHRALTDNRQHASARSSAGTPLLLILVAVLVALTFGLVFYGQWETLLRFWWSRSYGETDPIFGRDIGFYLFEVPFLELLQDSVLAASLIALASLLLAYSVCGTFRFDWKRGIEAPARVQRHLAANLVLFLLALAWGLYLDRFDLLQSSRGAVYGAGYTDFNVVLPAIWTMMGATLALAAASLFPLFHRGGLFALCTLGGYLVIWFVSLVILPSGVQALRVEPNELELESPFLRHNIAMTRKAYQLDRVDERSYGALRDLTPEALEQNQQTVDNIRLWDWRPLSQTFRQLQQIRAYYEFGDVDVDRYRVDDAYRQVMVAAREMTETLPGKAETWLNRRLQYTHGYGVAMSLTAMKSEEGSPILIVKDLPPRTAAGISISQPAIYYGEITSGYRIVNTSVPEFDYPKGDKNVYAKYSGRGGVLLNSFWKKLLFAWHQFDINILITSYITPESRIQLWREVRDRVERLAPFLLFDADPYPVVSEGRLYWIQDAYTVSTLFPYSEPHRGRFNYIRNSVKVVVDAYDGEVTFYVVDPHDPVLRVFREAMPSLFAAFEELPDDLRRHLRYPQDRNCSRSREGVAVWVG